MYSHELESYEVGLDCHYLYQIYVTAEICLARFIIFLKIITSSSDECLHINVSQSF